MSGGFTLLCKSEECTLKYNCRRYLRHLEIGSKETPYLSHTVDLGWGKTYTFNVTDGCCEYIPLNTGPDTPKFNPFRQTD